MSYKQVAKGEPPQQPICILNIVLPETILPESALSEPDLLVLHKKYGLLKDGGLGELMFLTLSLVQIELLHHVYTYCA